ncbi:MAG: DUF423 domain-containing protein [Bacteroidota bacterium]
MTAKTTLRLGGLFLMLAVILGAFAAHGLESKITADQIDTFETGVRYQFYHAFALLVIGILLRLNYPTALRWVVWMFAIGILLFSGSIYLLACRDFLGIADWWWLGPITPVGGTFFIVGWGIFLVVVGRKI